MAADSRFIFCADGLLRDDETANGLYFVRWLATVGFGHDLTSAKGMRLC